MRLFPYSVYTYTNRTITHAYIRKMFMFIHASTQRHTICCSTVFVYMCGYTYMCVCIITRGMLFTPVLPFCKSAIPSQNAKKQVQMEQKCREAWPDHCGSAEGQACAARQPTVGRWSSVNCNLGEHMPRYE